MSTTLSNPGGITAQERAALSRVVVVANGKGGAGKTSVAVHLAGLAAVAEWRVLLIDLDPQGDAGRCIVQGWPHSEDPEHASDDGDRLFKAIADGQDLVPTINQVRPGLDFVGGGARLDAMEDVVTGNARRAQDSTILLARALARVADDYDLIVIDTPPTRPMLLQLALAAARWLVIPTRSDRMSISGLHTLTRDVESARRINPTVEVLGAALVAVGTQASTVRSRALDDIGAVLEGIAPTFHTVVRYAEASANETPEMGLLAHELADRAGGAEPWYAALREGRVPTRIIGSMSHLAGDYVRLSNEILRRIAAREEEEAQAMAAAQ